MIYTFDSVKLNVKKSGKCLCGKRLTRSYTFEQTLNPFNKNDRGFPKTSAEIMTELKAEAEVWQQEPPHHDRPAYWRWTDKQRKDYDNGKTITVTMSCGYPIEVTNHA